MPQIENKQLKMHNTEGFQRQLSSLYLKVRLEAHVALDLNQHKSSVLHRE